MNTLTSLTIWIVLSTIIPGLITITCLLILTNWVFLEYAIDVTQLQNWGGFAIAVTIMVITQTLGILNEKWLERTFPLTITGFDITKNPLEPIEIPAKNEYKSLYCIVSRLTDKDDAHGHIQRIIAQFFLSANNLVSYSISAIVLFVLLFLSSEINVLRVIIFFCGMALFY